MFNNRLESNHPCLISDFNKNPLPQESEFVTMLREYLFIIVQYGFFSEMDVEFYKMHFGHLSISLSLNY